MIFTFESEDENLSLFRNKTFKEISFDLEMSFFRGKNTLRPSYEVISTTTNHITHYINNYQSLHMKET